MLFYRRLAFCLLSILLILVLIGSFYYENFSTVNTPESKISETQASTVYTLKEYNGFLALFVNESLSPEAVYSVPIASLPEADRKMLTDGISVTDISLLQSLLEDFTG